MVTRNRDSFMPTKLDRAIYGRVATDGTFTFTNYAREDDYSEYKELWKLEVKSAVKKWKKFINNGKATILP